MRSSMRTARKEGKQRVERDQGRQKSCQLEFLKLNIPIGKTMHRIHGETVIRFSKGTVWSIKKALHEKDE